MKFHTEGSVFILKIQTVKNLGSIQHLCMWKHEFAKSMHASFCVIQGPDSITFMEIMPELLRPHGFFRKQDNKTSSATLIGLFFFLRCCKMFHLSRQWLLWSRILDELIFIMPETPERTKKWSLSSVTALGYCLVPHDNTFTTSPASGILQSNKHDLFSHFLRHIRQTSYSSPINISNRVTVQTAGFHISSCLV